MSAATSDASVELREPSWIGLGLTGAGAFVLLIFAVVLTVTSFTPAERPPNIPALIAMVGGTVLALAIGIYLLYNSRVGLRIRPNGIELPAFNLEIPWSAITEIEVVFGQQLQGTTTPLLLLRFTSEFREQTGKRLFSNTEAVKQFRLRPDVCLAINYLSLGPGIETVPQFADDLRRRQAAAAGKTVPTAGDSLPDMDAPLVQRDMSLTGPSQRVYIHTNCGTQTCVTGSSLYWVTNPLRFMSGSICAQCGEAMDVALQWQDTGETVSRFRRRMRRHTPLFAKLLNYLILPAMIAAAAFYVIPLVIPPAPNLSPQTAQWLAAGFGYFAGLMLFWLTPLAALGPALCGMAYHKYR